jgi:CheY-like chemotaxis protein
MTHRAIRGGGSTRAHTSNDMPIARILVVDDDRLTRQMMRDLLEGADLAVAEAVVGADDLAQASAGQPDLFLLDLMIPGMEGWLYGLPHLEGGAGYPGHPSVFLTASLDHALNRTAYTVGAVARATKPFRREALPAWSIRPCTGWPVVVSAMKTASGMGRTSQRPRTQA